MTDEQSKFEIERARTLLAEALELLDTAQLSAAAAYVAHAIGMIEDGDAAPKRRSAIPAAVRFWSGRQPSIEQRRDPSLADRSIRAIQAP